jgi:hypothetical protein
MGSTKPAGGALGMPATNVVNLKLPTVPICVKREKRELG